MSNDNIRECFPVQFYSQTALGRHAMDCAEALLKGGWTSMGSAYDISTFYGDAEAYEEKTGEKLDRNGCQVLERMIRKCLDGAWEKMIETNPALND